MASGFKKFLGNILPILGAATGNPLLAAGGGAIGGAISGGTKGALMGGVTGGASSYLGNKFFGSSNTKNPLSSLTGLFGGGASGGGGSPLNPLSQMGSLVSTQGTSGAFNPTLAAKAFGQTSSQPVSGLGGGLNKITSGLNKNPLLLGLGLMGGSQFIQSPKVPELPQSVLDFQNAAKQGNQLQNQAQQLLSQQMGQTQQNLGQPEIDAINRQYDLAQEQELKQIDSMYKSLRPGTDPLTDTSYQKDLARVRDRYATLRADSVAQAQRQISNDFASQKATQIAQAVGLSQQQMQQLATLSQYDLDRQLSQLNIDYSDKQALRDYILQLGGNIAASGFQTNPFADMFGGQ